MDVRGNSLFIMTGIDRRLVRGDNILGEIKETDYFYCFGSEGWELYDNKH